MIMYPFDHRYVKSIFIILLATFFMDWPVLPVVLLGIVLGFVEGVCDVLGTRDA